MLFETPQRRPQRSCTMPYTSGDKNRAIKNNQTAKLRAKHSYVI